MTAQPFKTIVLDLLQQGHLDEESDDQINAMVFEEHK